MTNVFTTIFMPAVVVGSLLLAPGFAQAQIPPVGVADDYYDDDLDNLYDVDPRNYDYLPRSYEYPWMYAPIDYATKFGPYGYGRPAGYGLYDDGYEDDDWYYDYYDRDGGYFTGLNYEEWQNYRARPEYDPVFLPDEVVDYPYAPRRLPGRIDYDDWYREPYDDEFDDVDEPEIEWYDW